MDGVIDDVKEHKAKNVEILMKNFDPDFDVIDRRILFEITGREQIDDELYSESDEDDDIADRVNGPLKLGRHL